MSFDLLDPDQLLEIHSPDQAAALFKKSVRMVEIEVFSYCNRKCWFCPNASVDRITSNTFLPHEMYSSIIDQLATVDYAGMISYSRYNEPLADPVIVERIAEARAKLPRAQLHTNTNGDYLNNEYVHRLYDAGLRSMNIQLYLRNNEQYDHQRTKDRAAQTLRRIGLPAKVVRDEPGEWFEQQLEFRDMKIRMYGRNFAHNGTSRGDTVAIHRQYVRTSPCLMPFNSVYIDYNGALMPCCNLRSDVETHKDSVIGNLNSQANLFLLYTSRFAAAFRRSLLGTQRKGGACTNCNFALEAVTPGRQLQMSAMMSMAPPLSDIDAQAAAALARTTGQAAGAAPQPPRHEFEVA